MGVDEDPSCFPHDSSLSHKAFNSFVIYSLTISFQFCANSSTSIITIMLYVEGLYTP
ncbi:hypothetical protein FIU95_19425 [Microbulbifer sp. THAF38]|nr:hypothetical protein FIU95_19425 [Microbulbifer sp. THAF38]